MSATMDVHYRCDRCDRPQHLQCPVEFHSGHNTSLAFEAQIPKGWRTGTVWGEPAKHFCPQCVGRRVYKVDGHPMLPELLRRYDAMRAANPADPDNPPTEEDWVRFREEHADAFWVYAKTMLPEHLRGYIWDLDRDARAFIDTEIPA